MKKEIVHPPKIALCRVCKGTGQCPAPIEEGRGPRREPELVRCPQCDGSGRVTVSTHAILDIRPYRPRTDRTAD